MVVRTADSNETATGIIYAGTGTVTSGVPANVYAQINIGNNQTLMALYTVPFDKTAYMVNWYATLNKATAATAVDLQLVMRPFGEVLQVKNHQSLVNVGTSRFNHVFGTALPIAPKTDIKIECIETSANGVDISAGFDLILVGR